MPPSGHRDRPHVVIALPPLVASSQWSWLPMSDIAAVSLGAWFLADSQQRSVQALADILQGDPPLALWVAMQADRLSSAPRSLADLAALLAAHGLTWLQWDAAGAAEIDRALSEPIAARVASAVLTSVLAAELAAPQSEAVRCQAQLLGLLHDPAQWTTVLQLPTSAQFELQSPKWLSPEHFDPAASQAVEQAIHKLGPIREQLPSPRAPCTRGRERGAGGEGRPAVISPGGADVPPALADEPALLPEYLQRGSDAAARWSATHQAARCLCPLMAKLAKLSLLERSLHDAVEAEKLAALAEFAAGAGHEINNPLAVIAGRAQLLLRDETDPERRRDLALVNAQAMRVNEMIADLRLFATPPELERQPLDLTALVRRLVEDMQPLAAGQQTTLALGEGSSPLWVEADPVQLIIAIRAICQNALDALGHRGRVEIALARDDEEASITVADDGPGILPEQRPHIFEPFYSARQAGRGVGMGLSKCWRIVTQHGGRIEVGGHAGTGAVFSIRLPRK